MGTPFQSYHREFRAYRDFMAAVPTSMRHLPVYITETDQIEPWTDRNQAGFSRPTAKSMSGIGRPAAN